MVEDDRAEEEDETGAPEKVAWPEADAEHPLERPGALREPRDESGAQTPLPERTPDHARSPDG